MNFKELAKLTVDAVREENLAFHNNQGSNEEEDEYVELSQEIPLEEWRKQIIDDYVKDMLDTSSFHGIPHIFDKKYPIRRFIWLCVTCIFLGYAIAKVHESTVQYFKYPFNTAHVRKYVDHIDFPAVSFCNLNDMKLSVVNGTLVDIAILDHNQSSSVSKETYHNVTLNAVHRLEDMMIDCEFDGQPCSAKNFSEFYWMEGDKCYTFNSGKIGHKLLSINGAGLRRSLQMTINIQHYDYYRDKKEAGLHLILHGHQETPVKIIGHMLSPGYSTYVKVEKKKIVNLKAPYKTDCGKVDLRYFNTYSMHTCWLEQLTDFVSKNCRCKDFFMPGDIPICNLSWAQSCMWPKWEEFERKKYYVCPLPCEIESFHHSSSRSLFPVASSIDNLVEKLAKHNHINWKAFSTGNAKQSKKVF